MCPLPIAWQPVLGLCFGGGGVVCLRNMRKEIAENISCLLNKNSNGMGNTGPDLRWNCAFTDHSCTADRGSMLAPLRIPTVANCHETRFTRKIQSPHFKFSTVNGVQKQPKQTVNIRPHSATGDYVEITTHLIYLCWAQRLTDGKSNDWPTPTHLHSLGNKAKKPVESYLLIRKERVRGWRSSIVAVRTHRFNKAAGFEGRTPHLMNLCSYKTRHERQ